MGQVAIPEYFICMLCLRSSPRCFDSIPKHCPLNVYRLQCNTALVRLLMTAAPRSAFSIKNSAEDTQESPGLRF